MHIDRSPCQGPLGLTRGMAITDEANSGEVAADAGRRRRWVWLGLSVMLLLVVMGGSVQSGASAQPGPPPDRGSERGGPPVQWEPSRLDVEVPQYSEITRQVTVELDSDVVDPSWRVTPSLEGALAPPEWPSGDTAEAGTHENVA